MVIIGGMNTTLGPVIGAAFVTHLPGRGEHQPVLAGGAVRRAVHRRDRRCSRRASSGSLHARCAARAGAAPGARGARCRRRRLAERRRRPARSRRRGRSGARAPALRRTLPSAAALADGVRAAVDCRGVVFGYTGGAPAVERRRLRRPEGHDPRSDRPQRLRQEHARRPDRRAPAAAERARSRSTGTVSSERRSARARARNGFMRTFQAAGARPRAVGARERARRPVHAASRGSRLRAAVWPLLPDRAARRATDARARQRGARFVGARAVGGRTRSRTSPHGVEQLTQLAAACVARPAAR